MLELTPLVLAGQVEKLELTVKLTVDSSKDKAYESQLYIFMDPELAYIGVGPSKDDVTAGDEVSSVAPFFTFMPFCVQQKY